MDRMQALQYFLEVAETGSFSKAAKSFSVPASSISRAVQNLVNRLSLVQYPKRQMTKPPQWDSVFFT